MTEERTPAPQTAYVPPPPSPREFPDTLPLPRREAEHERPGAVGRHGVVGVLGEGGMGSVLAVVDPLLGRETAAKVIRGEADESARTMFMREALITAQLEHPGIVPLYDVGELAPGTPYFTMRKIVGTDLETRLESAPPLAEVLPIFLKVCEAVAFAHSRGIIHRDLKPANVMTGEFGEVYVCDWGLAKRLGESEPDRVDRAPVSDAGGLVEGVSRTLDGTILGTPGYMPPEQAHGRIHELDLTSDVFSLGAVLYHVLAGVAPYAGKTVWDILEQACAAQWVPPSVRAPGRHVPWELEVIVAKAMAPAREDRYASVLAMKADVEAYLAGRLVGAARYGALAAARKWLARNPAVWRSALVLALVAASVLGWRWREHRRAVAVAKGAVRAADPARWVAAAREVPLDPNPLARVRPDARELSRLGESIAALQEGSRALSELARLTPEDAQVKSARFAVLTALGRLAEVRGEDAMAELAYAQAATLGVDDPAAHAMAAAAVRAKGALLAHRRVRIHARLDEARAGSLAGERAMSLAVLELASFRERQTVEELAAVLDQGSRDLVRAAVPVLVATDPGNEAALALATRRWLVAAEWPTTAAETHLLDLACDRLAQGSIESSRVVRSGAERLGDRQIAELGAGAPERALELACVVLGLLDDARGAVEPLVRVIHAHADERRAVPAGLALAHLAQRSPEALAALFGIVGIGRSPSRLTMTGPFWVQVKPVLELAGLRSSEVGTTSPPGPAPTEVESVAAYITRAMAKEAVGDVAGARAVYEEATARHPTSGTLHLNLGAVRHQAGDLEGAIAAFTRALELDPRDADALSNRGSARKARGDRAGALEDYNRALEIRPAFAIVLNNRGNLHFDSGNVAAAIADFTRAIELDAQYVEPRSNRGRAYLDLGEYDLATTDLDFVIAHNPRHGAAHYNRGRVRFHQGRWDECIADASRALELDPRIAMAYLLRGQAQGQRGNQGGLVSDFETFIRLSPDHADAHMCRGAIELARGEGDLGLAAFTRALELDPDNIVYLSYRGRARCARGDFAGATLDYDRAIALAPRHAGLYQSRGVARFRQGDWAGVIADTTKASELSPRDPEPLFNRGLAREEQRDHAGAVEDFTRAIALNETFALAYYNRGNSRRSMGDKAGAIADYDRAIALEARTPSFYINRGYLLFELGDYARAIVDQRRAIDLDPSSWRAHFALGMALYKSGNKSEALPAFLRARELVTDPVTQKQIDAWIAAAR